MSAFDNVALTYDISFTNSTIGKIQRMFVWQHIDKLLNSNKIENILELNCGTGYDALEFAKLQYRIVATDVSAAMLDITKSKLASFDNASVKYLDLRNYQQKPELFNLIFSNFGGLNCLSYHELKKLEEHLHIQLKANGVIAFVIMGKKCIWENLYFFFKDKMKYKRREKREFILTNINGNYIKTYYYSPNDIKIIFRNYELIKVKPIGLFIPPSYLNNKIENKKWTPILVWLDKLFSFSIFANYSDHFYIELKKK